MSEPTAEQMEALERALSRRRGLRQELDEIRNADDPPKDEDSEDWLEYESPIIIDIMREAARAVLDASEARIVPPEEGDDS